MSEPTKSTGRSVGAFGEHLEQVTRETREYLAEIIRENDRLRAVVVQREIDSRSAAGAADRIASLEQENRRLKETVAQRNVQVETLAGECRDALAEAARAGAELARLQTDIRDAAERHGEFVDRFGAIDQKNANLTYLYVANHRLHSTLDRREVLDAISDTIVNFVGSEDFAVYELNAETGVLELAASVGGVDEGLQSIPLGTGALGEVAARGETFVAGAEDELVGGPGGKKLIAVVPLKRGWTLIGVIAIFSLLPQKNGTFDGFDLELFDLLASQAATALYCARLHLQHMGTN